MSNPPIPPGISDTKYNHAPSGDTAGWATDERLSFVISHFCGDPQLAPVRCETYISA